MAEMPVVSIATIVLQRCHMTATETYRGLATNMQNFRCARLFVCILSISTLSIPIGTAEAQDGGAPTKLVDDLAKCLEIREDRERLACSDRAGRALVDAARRRDVVVVDRAEVSKTRRSLFGFALPRVKLFEDEEGGKVEEIDEIEAKVTGVAALPQGRYAFTVEGGARWSTTEPWARGFVPKVGDVAKIRRAALGSYFVKIGTIRAVRAMRVG